MDIKNVTDLKEALKGFDYELDENTLFLGTGSEQVVVKSDNKVIHFIGLGYSKLKDTEVSLAVSEMKKYFQVLKGAGVTTSNPDFDNMKLFTKPFNLIVVEDSFAGTPVDEQMGSDEEYLIIFEKLLDETLKAVKNGIPMDSSSKNYVIDEVKVVYVDFFVPYTAEWQFHGNKSEEYSLFTSLNFFVPNCELFIFVSKAIIKKPQLKQKILEILYSKIDGELKKKMEKKFDSEEYKFLLTNHQRLMEQYKEELSDDEIFEKIGYYDRTKKLLIKGEKVIDSSLSISELAERMNDDVIARPYNCLIWTKEDIEDAKSFLE